MKREYGLASLVTCCADSQSGESTHRHGCHWLARLPFLLSPRLAKWQLASSSHWEVGTRMQFSHVTSMYILDSEQGHLKYSICNTPTHSLLQLSSLQSRALRLIIIIHLPLVSYLCDNCPCTLFQISIGYAPL